MHHSMRLSPVMFDVAEWRQEWCTIKRDYEGKVILRRLVEVGDITDTNYFRITLTERVVSKEKCRPETTERGTERHLILSLGDY